MPACESKTIDIKTGSSVVFDMVYKDNEGAPIPLEGYEIDMDFRDPTTGILLAETSVGNGIRITGAEEGEYTVNAGNSVSWPEGEMIVDIKYTLNGQAQHTEDFILNFTKGRSQ